MKKIFKNKQRTAIYKMQEHKKHTEQNMIYFNCRRCSIEAWNCDEVQIEDIKIFKIQMDKFGQIHEEQEYLTKEYQNYRDNVTAAKMDGGI